MNDVLILGGTAQGRELAAALTAAGLDVVTSLAGVTRDPARVAGSVRSGGFGGVDGLADWLREHPVVGVVDATHPFAAGMSANAARACGLVGVPLLRLDRPGWAGRPDAARWTWVADHDEAAAAAAQTSGVVFLAVGRSSLDHYVEPLRGRPVVARVAEAAGLRVPEGWQVLAERGPFDAASEARLFADHGVRVLITKDSGGAASEAKLDVAADLGVTVIMVSRPASGVESPAAETGVERPAAVSGVEPSAVVVGVETVDSVPAARDWALAQFGSCAR